MPEYEKASIEYSGVSDELYNQKMRPYLQAFDAALIDIADGLVFLMQDSATEAVHEIAQSAADKIEAISERLENSAALCDCAADYVEAFLIEVGVISAIKHQPKTPSNSADNKEK
jgi:hypothetical protein